MTLNDKEFVLQTFKEFGKSSAENIQQKADDMTGTELYDKEEYIPDFSEAVKRMNMLDRKIGFVCKSSAGRVVRLLQKYDSTIYTQEPEELSSLWGFKWSTDPKKALPFIALSTSPYNVGECCTENGNIYISKIPNNVFAPSAYPDGWTLYEEV